MSSKIMLVLLVSLVPFIQALPSTSPFYDATTSTVGTSLSRYPPSLASDRQGFGMMSPYGGYQSTMNPALGTSALQQPMGIYGSQQNLGLYGSLGAQQPFLNNDPRLALLQDPQVLSYLANMLSTSYPSMYGTLGTSGNLRDPSLLGNRGYMGQYDPMVNSYYGSTYGSQYGLDSSLTGLGFGSSSYPGRYSGYGYQQSFPYGSSSTISTSSVADKNVKRDPKFAV